MEQRLALRERPRDEGPVMYQKWDDLLFLHWQFEIEEIQRTLPPGLYVDTYEGRAYIGLVPFYMNRIRPRFCPPVPGISYFLEINMRTYVYDDKGIPGVWFYSLDANQWLATKIGRKAFNLPYHYAQMSAKLSEEKEITYRTRRYGTSETSLFRYRPISQVRYAQPGTFEFFLVERYILFALNDGKLYSGQVYHTPYPICEVEVKDYSTTLLEFGGFTRPKDRPDNMLMSPGVDVDIFYIKRVK